MTLPLPIVNEPTLPRRRSDGHVDYNYGFDAGTTIHDTIEDLIENLPNAFPPRPHEVPQPGDPKSIKQIMGFFTDATLCIGCKACEVACKQWNQLPADGLDFTGYSY